MGVRLLIENVFCPSDFFLNGLNARSVSIDTFISSTSFFFCMVVKILDDSKNFNTFYNLFFLKIMYIYKSIMKIITIIFTIDK